jgi:NADPH-dependent 2,4-dienoyl-CoA reductase/sulfur reductase-like enzyme
MKGAIAIVGGSVGGATAAIELPRRGPANDAAREDVDDSCEKEPNFARADFKRSTARAQRVPAARWWAPAAQPLHVGRRRRSEGRSL